ncbi:hypothetical protein LX36DRAFT_687969 [Colletotrichum falcatum]|nr:hypothetical protein LX36DRAFT_687969 [Colletotrichum falcatum]
MSAAGSEPGFSSVCFNHHPTSGGRRNRRHTRIDNHRTIIGNMKTTVRSLLLLGHAAASYAAAAPGTADARVAAICGDLGVLTFEDGKLPDGVSPGDVRMCAGHPNGQVRVLDPLQGASACYYTAPYGCSGGYCWKACGETIGDGRWCWTAGDGGIGPWSKCSTYVDCGTNPSTQACGVGCIKPNQCGCSC